MSGGLFGSSGGYSCSSTPAKLPHACHCIGCCKECGLCRTWPGHTADKCAKIADLNRQRAVILTS